MSGGIWIGLIILCSVLLLELMGPVEGFTALVPVSNPSYFSQYVMKRGDVGPTLEQSGYLMDPRYFHDYADVQRYGMKQDYCRVVVSKQEGSKPFFACALGGTERTSSVAFRTPDPLRLSRDDYMRDIGGHGYEAYCRILDEKGSYQPLCRKSTDLGFSTRDEVDPNPPESIQTLLSFYEGCVFWLRLRDDLLDYVNKIQVQKGGGIVIDETPNLPKTKGLHFNGDTEFLRIGDAPDLTLGSAVKLRTLRATSIWVKFDRFTNNAHIYDFGDGAGNNNVILGILGKGDPTADDNILRPGCGTDTLPDGASGAQFTPEVTPQQLLETTRANVDKFVSIDPEVEARKLSPSKLGNKKGKGTGKATLLYEVWDARQRKMSIKINNLIPEKVWTHIVVTATNADATRPDVAVYVNGEQVYVQPSGFLPQINSTTNNYIGKSNWINGTSTYELRDELFNGSLFDFRGYNTPLSEGKIKTIMAWGKAYL
jgi:Concanavalin A-like lectin/glucanases superfamily